MKAMAAKKAKKVRIVVNVQVKARRALLEPRKDPQIDGVAMVSGVRRCLLFVLFAGQPMHKGCFGAVENRYESSRFRRCKNAPT